MTFSKNFFCSLTLLLFFVSTVANAQSGTSGAEQSSLNLDISSDFDGLYFQDVSGLQLAIQGIPYETSIDESTYLLGTNDVITVEIQGIQNILFRSLMINSSGEIVIPSIGAIRIDDKTISEAQAAINEASRQVYNNTAVKVSIEIPKPVHVHVSGSIPYPGKYILPAQVRVDLAILQSIVKIEPRNGVQSIYAPNYTSQILKEGSYSYRNILIEHTDGTYSSADLIHYFRTGDLESNPVVKDGDRISLRRTSRDSPKVSISGAVSFGYELEYRSGDTPQTLINISGGFESNADESKIFIYRRSGSSIEKIEVPREDWASYELQENDRLVVPYNRDKKLTSSAWVSGEVILPGNFPILSGETTIHELLELSGGLTEDALPNAAYLLRGTSLENEIPNKFNTELMKRTSDQPFQGLEYLDLETNLSRNRVSIDLSNAEELKELKLFDGDRLFIPKDEQTIFVFGQVNNPGYFPFAEIAAKSVFDYVNSAGGFALSADKDRIFVIKAGNGTWFKPQETRLESGDKIFIDRLPTEDLNALRAYEIQKAQLRNQRTQLIMTGITTITGIITTYVAIRRL